jgi:Leucine-rich repeat (LRR) protein
MSDAEIEDHDYEGEGEEEESATDLVVGVPLTKDICAKALSRLERVGNGSEFAYVKFNGSQLELNDISLLSEYVHLRYIYLSSNQITDILPMSNIKQLLSVILDRNNIESFNLPKMEYLQLVDLSYNKMNTFEGLDHPRLKCLNLNHNKLCNLDTMLMDTFVNLQVLELRANQFQSLKGLVPLKSLKKLYLAQNRISDLTPLAKLTSLEILHLRENEILSLAGLRDLTSLKEINLRTNLVADINEFDQLSNANQLIRISMMDNPVWEEDDLRIRLLIKMKNLKVINKEEVTEDEIMEMKEMQESQQEANEFDDE